LPKQSLIEWNETGEVKPPEFTSVLIAGAVRGSLVLRSDGTAFWNGKRWISCMTNRVIDWDVRYWAYLPAPPDS